MTYGKRGSTSDLSQTIIKFSHKKPRRKSHTNETFDDDMGTPCAIRFAESFTQVSKTKSEIDASGQHNKLRHVKWHLELPGKKYPKHKGVVNKIGHTITQVLQCDAGVQKVTDISNYMLRGQLLQTWNAAAAPTPGNNLAISPFDANVDERSAGNIISNAAQNRSYDKVYIQKITGSLALTNLGNVSTDVWVFAYVTKTPNEDGPTTRWSAMNTATFTGMTQFPGAAVQAGNSASPGSDPTKGYPTLETIGYRPSALPALKKMYKTIGKLHITLMPGETTDLEYVIHVGKYFDKREVTSLPTQIIPYKTVQLMLIQQGAPVRTMQVSTQYMHHSANQIGYINNHYYHVVPVLGENKTPFHIVDANEIKTAYASVGVSDKLVNDMDTTDAPRFT